MDEWIAGHGPWLYWCINDPTLWPWVLRDGIQPRMVTGQAGLHATMGSRPEHIYFLTDMTPRARLVAGATGEPQARVDIRSLDISRLGSDEDRVYGGVPLERHSPDVKALSRWAELATCGPDETVGDWMNRQTGIVDQPDWVQFSMENLTVAYRGNVVVDHLELLPLYLKCDWEPAEPGEEWPGSAGASGPAHYTGPPEAAPA